MSDLGPRNLRALLCGLENLTLRVQQQEVRLGEIQTGLTALAERLVALDHLLLAQKVALAGHGPTVRS